MPTRPKGYRKVKGCSLLSKLVYRKYPNFEKALNNRYLNYNRQVEKIEELEKDGRIFVFRPSEHIEINRLEKDTKKLTQMHKLGLSDARDLYDKLIDYMQ